MSVGPTAATPPRHVSPVRKAFHRHHICRPISQHHAFAAASPHIDGPSSSTSSASPIISTTKTHLANLDRVLLTKQPSPPPPPPPLLLEDYPQSGRPSRLNLLSLPSALFPSPEEISPHSIGHLHHLLSNSSRPSPRGPIASRWRQFHGTNNWEGLLDPLDDDLRRELVRYGDLIQATYQAFGSEAPGVASIPSLPDQSYRVTRHLFATASVELPSWFATVAPWTKVTPRTSWIGYVAVCDNEREIRRMGRRDIVVALRGTATCLEWAENFRTGLVPIDDDGGDHSAKKHRANAPKVECGFRSLYKTPGHDTPSLSSAVVEELRRLTEQYAGEEVSVTLTGHSLGAALAVLAADEVAALGVPTAVFSFGGPRVGNRAFAERVEARGAKVLRVVNARDLVTRVPGMLPLPAAGGGGYAHVGRELLVDSRKSPYLRPDADPACCHDLEAYLHLVDGFMATDGPFRADAKRGLARLLRHQGGNVKQVYVSVARALRSQGAPTFCSCSQSAFEPVHRKRGSAMSDPYRYQKSLQLKGAEQLSRTWRTRNSSSSIVDRPI